MFNEKATMFLLRLFDFRVSFKETIQPAGLTASELSLLPVAQWVSSHPTSLPPSPPAGSFPDLPGPPREVRACAQFPQARTLQRLWICLQSRLSPAPPSFWPASYPLPGHPQEPLRLLAPDVHDLEGSFPSGGF